MLLNQDELEKLSNVVREIESKTDAELVLVLCRRADNYVYAPNLLAAILAMLTPLASLYWPFWLDLIDLVYLQAIIFALLALIFRIPILMQLLVPKRTKRYRASNVAMRQFLQQSVHTTSRNLGVLIFVSEFERYVEIVADHGLKGKIHNSFWAEAVNDALPLLKKKQSFEAFLRVLEKVGGTLEAEFPATRQKQELPDHVIVI